MCWCMCLGLNHVYKYSTTEFYDSFEAKFLGYRLPSMRYKLNNEETVFNQYSSRIHSWTDINRDMDIDMKVTWRQDFGCVGSLGENCEETQEWINQCIYVWNFKVSYQNLRIIEETYTNPKKLRWKDCSKIYIKYLKISYAD